MRRFRAAVMLCLCVLLAGACDRMPLDAALGDDALDLLAGGGSAIPLPLSAPGLLGSALVKVYADEGAAAVWTRVAELRRLHEAAGAAVAGGDAGEAARLTAEARAEELRIVLETLGAGTAGQVLDHASEALGRVRLQIADGDAVGEDLAPVVAGAAEVEVLIERGAAAHAAGDHALALDLGTRAVARLDEARHMAAEIAGTPSADRLFERALRHVAGTRGDAAAAELAAPHRRLTAEARAAVLGGRSRVAQDRLAAARAEAIRVVLATFGDDAAASSMHAVTERLERSALAIAAVRRSGTDSSELDRMERAAQDLALRARQAWRAGDAATTLDLASHAAGLVDEILVRLAASR
jgi:hypothetical protein